LAEALVEIQNELEEQEIERSNSRISQKREDFEDMFGEATMRASSYAAGPSLIVASDGNFLYVYKNKESGKCWYESAIVEGPDTPEDDEDGK
jgi:hypothetical protein